MLTAINYNITLSRNGYSNRLGLRQVVIELRQYRQRRTLNTHLHVSPQDFHAGRVQPTSPNFDLLNRGLRRTLRRLMELEDEMTDAGQQPTPDRLIEAFRHNLTPSATISEWVASVITPSARKESTKGLYNTLATNIETFAPGLRLRDINYDLLQRWQNWMRTQQKLAENTIIIRMKTLRCLVSEAVKRDIIGYDSDPFRRIRIPEMKARREHLSEQELEQLEHMAIADTHLSHVRDAFLFCCYTGLRWGDFRSLSTKNLSGHLLVISQRKTGHDLRIPLDTLFGGKPARLLERYLTLERLAAVGDNKQANKDLRQVAQLAAIGKHLHWHLARHTCATLLNQRGLRMQEIQYILGHQRQATTERHYAETVYEQVQQALLHAFADARTEPANNSPTQALVRRNTPPRS